jgi:hypothetical protein
LWLSGLSTPGPVGCASGAKKAAPAVGSNRIVQVPFQDRAIEKYMQFQVVAELRRVGLPESRNLREVSVEFAV